jgi:hypothetical protein
MQFATMRLIVTLEVGPRIIELRLPQGENILKQVTNELGSKAGRKWRFYGGHRLWHAPEHPQRTYVPDNAPVSWEKIPGGVRITQRVEEPTGIQKEIDIVADDDDRSVIVKHRLTNKGLWPVRLAPWALTVLKEGALGFAPLPPYGRHDENLLPTGGLVTWAYTKFSDTRLFIGGRLVQMLHDPKAEFPQKIGITPPCSWIAGFVEKTLFVKTVTPNLEAEYPDRGSSIELFTNKDILELETLGPLTTIQPGGDVEHIEQWYVAACDSFPDSEEEREELALSLL